MKFVTTPAGIEDYIQFMQRFAIVLMFAALPALAETIVYRPCQDETPDSMYEDPSCADFELNIALIESAETGDASAIALLRERYDVADTYSERHRIAGVLLRLTPDDAEIWNDIAADAELAIRFAGTDEVEFPDAYIEWCEQRDIDPHDHRMMLHDAFAVAASDVRSQSLLLSALETHSEDILQMAVGALAAQRHADALPAIDAALARMRDSPSAAMWLTEFKSDRADEIAFKYLSQDDREIYQELR